MALCESGGNVRLGTDAEAHAEKKSKISKQVAKASGPLPVHDDDSQQKSARAQSDKRKSLASAIDMSQRDRAARIAMEGVQPTAESSQRGDNAAGLTNDQIGLLYSNCIKLAAENKITTRNTWNLKLIDHMIEIVNMTDEDSDQTNFQKASCTLEAGVRIYSCRVDAVHAETFKVLGGLHRSAGSKEEPDTADGEEGGDPDDEDGGEDGRKESGRKHAASSSVTLEPSFESLRLKKLDTSFAVDPLFHKTSAQFDEGGAKGLLLSTLSCYRGCHLIFDSDDVPDASVDETSSTAKGPTSHTMLDLSQLARPLENACSLMGLCHGITPALDGIRAMLGYDDEDKDAEVASLFYEYEDDDEGGATASSKRRLQAGAWGMTAEGGVATLRGEDRGADARGAACREEPEASYGGHGNYGDDDDGGMDYGGGDHDDDGDYGEDAGVAASSSVYVDAVSDAGTAFFSGDSGGTHAGGDEVMSRDHQGPPTGSPGPAHSSDASLGGSLGFGSYTSEQLSGWAAAAGAEPALGLSLLLGSAGQKAAAWAGPDHWRFRPRAATPADDAAEGEEDASSGATKAKKGGKKAPFFIDFEALPEVPAGTFTLATKRGEIEASAATLPLRGAGASGACATLLPDDLQYAPRELMCLFLKPSWQGLLSGEMCAARYLPCCVGMTRLCVIRAILLLLLSTVR
eukprot:jgi/Mesvir1/9731/Mv12196-RA.2